MFHTFVPTLIGFYCWNGNVSDWLFYAGGALKEVAD